MINEIEQEQELAQHSKYLVEKFNIGEVVERGYYVILSKCKHVDIFRNQVDCVVKETLHSEDELKCCTKFCFYLTNEYQVSSQLSHPNIVSPLCANFKYDGGCSVFFPQAECDAFTYLLTRDIDISVVKLYFKSMILGLDYLHNQQLFAHNDFKLENVLVFLNNDKDSMFQITDFGYSYYLGNKHNNCRNYSKYWTTRNDIYLSPTSCQSVQYKQFRNLQEKPGDMFGLGCTLFMILFRKYPFGSNTATLNEKIKVCEDIQKYGYQYFLQFEPAFKICENDWIILVDLIISLLVISDECRNTSYQLMSHQWVQQPCNQNN